MSDHDGRVRQRAYQIWTEEGCPEGRAEIHWEMARELVAIEENFSIALKPAPVDGAESPGGEPIVGTRCNADRGAGRWLRVPTSNGG